MTSAAKLTKTETGYVTPDGRWTVEPTTIGEGVTGWAGGRGWSNGHREWVLTDTTGVARLSRYGNPSQITLDTLWRVRDVIAAHREEETRNAR